MRALVTGGLGFIGSHLVEALHKRGDQVIILDNFSRGEYSRRIEKELEPVNPLIINGDIRDFELVKRTVAEGVDVIYHMAALPSHRLALQRPHEYGEIDLMGTLNVLEAARLQKNPPLVLFASTNKVYGKQKCPWKEWMPPQPEGPYAVAKWASEKLCEMYHTYYGLSVVVLRYHHVIGARSNPELAASVFVDQALENKHIEIHGLYEGKEFVSASANYTDIHDAIEATLLATEKVSGYDVFNIANTKLLSVETIAKEIISALESKSILVHTPLLPHETLVHQSDVTKAKNALGFVAYGSIEQSIKDYIAWRMS